MANVTTVGQRFIALISHLGISKNAFAASLDKTATVIQHLVDERNKPGFDLLCKVFEVYPNVSKDWLLQGKGPMLNDELGYANEHKEEPDAGQQEPSDTADTATRSAVVEPAPEPEMQALPEQAPTPATPPVPASEAYNPLPPALATASVAAPAPADGWQAALYTQQMAHQLALAELRNQHLQEQQRMMQQMLDLMQRQLR